MSTDRPDLCHVVKTLASSMKTPRASDWARLKKVARYLLKHPYMKRVFYAQSNVAPIVAYSDSDWAGNIRTRRSTTGSVICHGNNVLLVKCSTQKVVALSSAEGEYYAMCRTATLAEFIRNVMSFWLDIPKLVELWVDASAAKAMAERRGVGKTRHIQARYLWLQDKVSEKALTIKKVDGERNVSDLMTKVMTAAKAKYHLENMRFYPSSRSGHLGTSF